MPQGTKISFVTWPDGKVDGRSVTLHGETMARENFIATYLPEKWFGRLPIGYVTDTLWKGAHDKGFRCHTIEIAADGTPKLEARS